MKRLSGSVLVGFLVMVAAVAHAGCGSGQVPVLQNGSTADGGGENDSGGGSDAAKDALDDGATPVDGASFACGTTTCGASQYCLNPCCGGAPPQCIAKPPGGVCPVGFHDAMCPGGTAPGCEADPCKPPPARCVDDPAKEVGCTLESGGRQLICVCA
jgi:hypothetical protein